MSKRIIILEGERPLSWNDLYGGKHWSYRTVHAARAHHLVRACLDPELPPFSKPVKITFTCYFDRRPQDASNLCVKIYEDGLIGWYLVNDGPEYVSEVVTRSRLDPLRPRVEIELEECEDPPAHGVVFECSECGCHFKQLTQLVEHKSDCPGGRGTYNEEI